MSKMKEWLLDRQENGDDGTGFTDYTQEGECDKCESTYELADRTNRCGECGYCGKCCTHSFDQWVKCVNCDAGNKATHTVITLEGEIALCDTCYND